MSGPDDIARVVADAGPAAPLAPSDRDLADLSRNDWGNGQRLIARHGADLRHVDEIGWYVFDGRRWQPPLSRDAPEAEKRAHRTAIAIVENESPVLAPELADLRTAHRAAVDAHGEDSALAHEAQRKVARLEGRIEAHRKFGIGSGNAGKIAAMLSLARPYCRAVREAFDADAWLLNVANGTLELDNRAAADVRLRGHDRADLISHLAPVAHDPEADAPRWRQFLDQAQPDPAIRNFLQRFAGYCATGASREQVLTVFHGKGRNGKSTFIEVIAELLGDYALTLPIQTFLRDDRRGGGDATPDLARLPGARFVTASEPEQGAVMAEALVKLVTGGERMSARPLFSGMFEFTPQFKLVISTNHKPQIRGGDDGIWGRLVLVPWPVSFLGREDLGLRAVLRAELPGVLNWLLDGVRLYRARGLEIPEAVRAATQQYRAEADPVGEFIKTCTTPDPLARVQAGLLYTTYARWCRVNALKPLSGTTFGKKLADLGYEQQKSSVKYRLGLALDAMAVGQIDAAVSADVARADPAAGGELE